jgi:hypothetical protein
MTVWDAWPVYVARYYARRTWDDLPGPWPVKVALILVCVAIPGQLDEIALIALTRACRKHRARQLSAAPQ